MAFSSASGHTNLINGNFVPVIFSKKVQNFFRKVSVIEAITNTDYQGEIANFGDTVNIIQEPTIVVSDYARGKTLNTQDLTDDEITLTVDQAKYFQFAVDDIEKKQSHINWEPLATSSGAYALRDSYDSNVLTYMKDNAASAMTYGSTGAPIDLGFDVSEESPLKVLNRLKRFLDVQNVPMENRWFVAGPLFWEQMQDENSKLMGVDFTGDKSSILRNGRVCDGLIRGFKCYMSNNMPTNGTWNAALAGHMSACSTASAITKTEGFRSQTTFADVVRGLHVYGRKLLRDESLALAFYKVD